MSDPTLEFFQKLSERSSSPKPDEDQKLYPGTTPPRNTGQIVDSGAHLWLNTLPAHEFLVNGKVQQFYTVGTLAKALGKKPVTIRSWEAKGWLPGPSFRTPPPAGEQIPGKAVRGRRLYTKEQLLFLVEEYTKYVEEPVKPNWPAFRNSIKRQYPK